MSVRVASTLERCALSFLAHKWLSCLLDWLSIVIKQLRSSHFGSPNHRKRCYIVGCRMDVTSVSQFEGLLHFIEKKCPGIHQQGSLLECCFHSNKDKACHVFLPSYLGFIAYLLVLAVRVQSSNYSMRQHEYEYESRKLHCDSIQAFSLYYFADFAVFVIWTRADFKWFFLEAKAGRGSTTPPFKRQIHQPLRTDT